MPMLRLVVPHQRKQIQNPRRRDHHAHQRRHRLDFRHRLLRGPRQPILQRRHQEHRIRQKEETHRVREPDLQGFGRSQRQ